ncbi:MAG: hypothetical protein ACKOES_11160 [Planctomycetaceae bacterium]
MVHFVGMLAAIALTALCWGIYGPVLGKGSALLQSPLRAFMCVGLAYFLIAIVVPLGILSRFGEKGAWRTTGVVWSHVAGAAGALGALGVILALRVFQGNPIYVMPLVFGGAPVVNTLLNAFINKAFNQLKAPFLAGLILVITGAVVVLLFRPQTGHGGVVVEAERTLGWLLSAMMAMLSWGAYGPVLHKGQMAMGGSRLRPLICIGVSYFLIAVLVPWALLVPLGDAGNWGGGGLAWSLAGGALGALGALGTILAFACGGKPFTVMPVVFGCAPVINTFATLALAATTPESVSPFFLAGMLIVAAGAATVLAFGPRGHAPPKPAPA